MPPATFSDPPPTGAERYAPVCTLGRGGMADVHLVSVCGPAGFMKLMVIKELRPELAHDDEFVSMFLDEARLAARLQHPQVVQTYEVARSGTRFYIAMEYLDGQPLHRVLQRLDPSTDEVKRLYLRAILETLGGLHYAHELRSYDGSPLGIVHRDVSPHNTFLLYSGHVKLVDFGIAKVAGASVDTRSGVVKGKTAYMAPEQAMAGKTDRRADVFSCGVMLWEALAGRRLWAGVDDVGIIARLLQGNLPRLDEVCPGLPDDLVAICHRALSIAPRDRFDTAEEMRVALVSAIQAHGLHSGSERIGKICSAAFEKERAKLTSAIRSHMAKQEAARSARQLSELQRFDDEDDEDVSGTKRVSPEALTKAEGRSSSGLSDVDPQRNDRSIRRPLLIGGGVMLLVALVGAAFLFGGRSDISQGTHSALSEVFSPPSATRGECQRLDKPIVELSGEIDDDATLSCGKDYRLKFNVFVVPGVTLTIEKGTTILGDDATRGALIVQPGGRLIARGTEDEPIVFTSDKPNGEKAPGDWGGVVLLGRAPVNLKAADGRSQRGQVEGITFGGKYGGDDPDDDSGVLEFVRIENSGNQLGPGNELNGLTMAGVGRGTHIDHVQVRHTSDDCFEFFGGTVDAKHLICQSSGDDGFDWDYGYSGRLQFLVLQYPRFSRPSDNGFEGDNDPNGSSNEPRSAPSIYNATLCGRGDRDAHKSYGILVRRGTHATIANSIVTGFHAGVDVRDRGTTLSIRGSILHDNVVHNVAFPETPEGSGSLANDDSSVNELELFGSEKTNSTNSPRLIDCADPTDPQFAPQKELSELAVMPPDDGFFDAVRYTGAVKDESDQWYRAPWTRWTED